MGLVQMFVHFPPSSPQVLQNTQILQKTKNFSTLNLKGSFVEAEPFPLSLRKKMREMRKCCLSNFGINPVIRENNQGSRNVSLCSHGPLFMMPSPSSLGGAPFRGGCFNHPHLQIWINCIYWVDEAVPALTFFCGPAVFLHLPSGEHQRQHLPQHSPKIALSSCPGGVGYDWNRGKVNLSPFLSFHSDRATRTWELGCCSQNKPKLLWGKSGAQKS